MCSECHMLLLGESGSSVLLHTLDYFVKSAAQLNVDSLTSAAAGSDICSPREREHFNRFVSCLHRSLAVSLTVH